MLDNLVDGVSDSHHPFYHKSTGLRAVVGLTSALSVVGSLLIALSYICFKDLRTKVREILMHIAFMDLGVGISNLVGIGVNFGNYYRKCPDFQDSHCINSTWIYDLCLVQGSLAHYSTLGSILWTISLSMYLYILISQKGTREARLLVRFAYFFCYLMPVGIVLWQRYTGRIGYTPYESTGWCGTISVRPNRSGGEKRDVYASIFSYNLWICLTFILIPVLSIAAHLYIRDEVKCSILMVYMIAFSKQIFFWFQVKIAGPNAQSNRLLSALQKLDYKFLLVPVVFILLRIWSFIGDIVFVYFGVCRIKPHALAKALMYLEVCGHCEFQCCYYKCSKYNHAGYW